MEKKKTGIMQAFANAKRNILEGVLSIESLEKEDGKFLLHLASATKTVYVDVTEILESITGDLSLVTNTNLQKIYRELPRSCEVFYEKDKIYLDMYSLYKTMYKACYFAKVAKEKVYGEYIER